LSKTSFLEIINKSEYLEDLVLFFIFDIRVYIIKLNRIKILIEISMHLS